MSFNLPSASIKRATQLLQSEKTAPATEKREGRLHQKIARARRDHAYNTASILLETGKKVFFHEQLNLKALSQRNKPKQDSFGKYFPNGQSAKTGLNKSWQDAAFGQFFSILKYKAEKAGAIVKEVAPAYSSALLSYKDEFVFTDCRIREYWDEQLKLSIDAFWNFYLKT